MNYAPSFCKTIIACCVTLLWVHTAIGLSGCTLTIGNPNDCSKCVIGGRYNIAGVKYNDDDPFEKVPVADVRITQIKDGFVEYCESSEYPNGLKYSRSCSEFTNSINRYNKIVK